MSFDYPTPLCRVAHLGQVDKVEEYLSRSPGGETPSGDEDTMNITLGFATDGGHLPVVEYLLRHGYERILQSQSVVDYQFYVCVMAGQVDLFIYYASMGLVPSQPELLLEHACSLGRLPFYPLLLRLCPETDLTPLATVAAQVGSLSTLLWLVSQGCQYDGEDLALIAAERGHLGILIYLRDRGVELSAALERARENDHCHLVEILSAKHQREANDESVCSKSAESKIEDW